MVLPNDRGDRGQPARRYPEDFYSGNPADEYLGELYFGMLLAMGGRIVWDHVKWFLSVMMIIGGLVVANNVSGAAAGIAGTVAIAGALLLIVALRVPTKKELGV